MYIFLFVCGFLILLSFAYGASSLAPRVLTRSKDLEKIDEIASLKEGDAFLEFGSGNARVSKYIAKHNPTAQVIGVEIVVPLFLYSRGMQKLFGPSNLKIRLKDGFQYPLNDIDVLYVFGMPNTLKNKLKSKIQKEMKIGSKCLSYIFGIEDREGGTVVKHKSDYNEGAIYEFVKS